MVPHLRLGALAEPKLHALLIPSICESMYMFLLTICHDFCLGKDPLFVCFQGLNSIVPEKSSKELNSTLFKTMCLWNLDLLFFLRIYSGLIYGSYNSPQLMNYHPFDQQQRQLQNIRNSDFDSAFAICPERSVMIVSWLPSFPNFEWMLQWFPVSEGRRFWGVCQFVQCIDIY